MKKIIWTIAAIVVCIGTLLICVLNKKEETTKSEDDVVKITEFNIEDRSTLVKDGKIYVGNNVKELENEFYDIKIMNIEDGVEVYLNKLWYETYGDDYIQDEYLAKICRELSGKCSISNGTEEFEYLLYKYIKDNYLKARKEETIQEIKVDDLTLNMKLTEENIVKLIIRSDK